MVKSNDVAMTKSYNKIQQTVVCLSIQNMWLSLTKLDSLVVPTWITWSSLS